MGKLVKIVLISVSSLIFLIIIAWRVDRTFFSPYIPHYQDQIRSDVTTLKFTVPKDEAGCLAKGGVWKIIGPRRFPECNLKTQDAGKICQGSNMCEGVCLAKLSYTDIARGMRGKLFKTNGTCSSFIKVVGCQGYVYQGWASIVCAD